MKPDNYQLTITVKHACGHYQLHTITAKDETDASQAEIRLSKTLCDNCKEALEKHNSNPKNTRLSI